MFVWVPTDSGRREHTCRIIFLCMFYKLVSECVLDLWCLASFQFVCWIHKKFNMHRTHSLTSTHTHTQAIETNAWNCSCVHDIRLCNAFGSSHIIMVLLTLKCVEPHNFCWRSYNELDLPLFRWWDCVYAPGCFISFFCSFIHRVLSLCMLPCTSMRLMISFESPTLHNFHGIFGGLALNWTHWKWNVHTHQKNE